VAGPLRSLLAGFNRSLTDLFFCPGFCQIVIWPTEVGLDSARPDKKPAKQYNGRIFHI
jgi:hypothetical protein